MGFSSFGTTINWDNYASLQKSLNQSIMSMTIPSYQSNTLLGVGISSASTQKAINSTKTNVGTTKHHISTLPINNRMNLINLNISAPVVYKKRENTTQRVMLKLLAKRVLSLSYICCNVSITFS